MLYLIDSNVDPFMYLIEGTRKVRRLNRALHTITPFHAPPRNSACPHWQPGGQMT